MLLVSWLKNRNMWRGNTKRNRATSLLETKDGQDKLLLAKGEAMIQQQQYEAATAYFTSLATNLPNEPEAFYRLGKIASLQADHRTAAIHLSKAVQLSPPSHPELLEGFRSLLKELLFLCDSAEFAEQFEINARSFADYFPNHRDIWYYMGYAYHKVGELLKAAERWQEGWKLYPDYLLLPLCSGLAYSKLGEHESADTALLYFLEHYPLPSTEYNKAGLSQSAELYKMQDIIDFYLSLTQQAGNELRYAYPLGLAYRWNWQIEQALQQFTIAIGYQATQAQAMKQVAKMHWLLGNTPAAFSSFQDYLALIQKDNRSPLPTWTEEDYMIVIPFYEAQLQNRDASLREHEILGNAYFRQADYYKAAQHLELARQTNSNADCLLLLSKTYSALGDHRKAITFAQQALEKNTHNPDAYYTVGMLYQLLGNEKKAATYLFQASQWGHQEAKAFLSTRHWS